jgi:hypothetical protein
METDTYIDKEGFADLDIAAPFSVETREILGVNDVNALGYDGSGVMINVHDTGVDFGHTALRDAMAVDEFGYPLSFEPMGRMSLTSLWSRDYWDGIYGGTPTGDMIDGWFSPRHTDEFGNISLTGYGNLLTYAADLGSLYTAGGLGISFPSNYTVGGLAGNVTGFAFGLSVTHNNGWIQFVPYLEADTNDDGTYDTLYVDYATGWALTMWWWTEDEAYYDLAPFDFSGAVAVTNNANLALSADIWNGTDFGVQDGYYDISMGSIGNVYDFNGYTDDGGVLLGIPEDGKTLGHLWDVGGHGTGCSGYVSAAWTDYELLEDEYEWDYPDNATFTIGGMAPGSTIIATAGFSDTATTLGWQWACGFDLNTTSGYWEYNNESTHHASVSSNSWGTSAIMDAYGIAMGWDMETMFIDYLSAPGYIHEDYPGMLFLTSTGNGGSGMGTSKQPSQSTAAVAVGASTVNWWRYATGYGDNETQQGNDHVIGWSDNGPAANGYPKIDILAPGAFDYSLTPVEIGGTTFTTIFGGTSASCPVVAGGMAILYQAWEIAYPGVPLTPDMAKVILKSTAKDIGYDPYMQGTGRIDVAAMVDYVNGANEELIAYSFSSPARTLDRTFFNFYYYYFGQLPPLAVQDLADTAIFGGALLPGESVINDLTVMGNLSAVDYEAVTFETTYEAVNSSIELNTTEYYSAFALEDLFDIAQLRSADYFQLILAMDFDDAMDYRMEHGRNPPYMYVTSLESGTVDVDPEWSFWNYGYDNNNFQDLFLPTNFIQASETPVYIRVRDYAYDVDGAYYDENHTGMAFTLSVRAFTRTVDPQVSLTPDGPGVFNVTIDVDPAAVPGHYEGYIIMNSTDTNQILVPYGYSVAGFVEEYNVDGWTYLSDGSFTGRPNDNGLYGCADWNWRPETGDWRFYDFYIENASAANTIALELEWVNDGSEMNMWLMDNYGWMIDYTDYLTNGGQYISELNAPPTKQRLLIGLPWTTSLWTVIVHSTTLAPTVDTVPLENFTLKVTYLNDTVDTFTEPTVSITVPGDNETAGGVLVTDDLYSVLWDVVVGNPIPEFSNAPYNNTLSITPAFIIEHTELLPAAALYPYTGSMIVEYTELVYLEAGDYVTGTLDWSDASDFDFLLIHAGDPYAFDSCIFNSAGATSSKPEHFEGYIPSTGWYEIVVEWYDGPGTDVTFDMFFAVLYDEVYSETVYAGTLMEVDMGAIGADEGMYLVTTTSAGWNFDHTINTRFIYDITDPTIVTDAVDETIDYADIVNFVWNATDFGGATYEILVNSEVVEAGAFSGDKQVTYAFQGLVEGVNHILLNVTDYREVSVTHEVDITVNACLYPTIVTDAGDETIDFFDSLDFQWNITDAYGGSYEILLNGTVDISGGFLDDYQLNYTFDGTPEGDNNITLIVTNIYGKTATDEVVITVNPPVDPTIVTNAVDETIDFFESTDLQWNITDIYGGSYEVEVNGVVVLDGDFTGDYQVNYTFDGTTDGVFDISISVTSISGQTVSDEVTITVNVAVDPTIATNAVDATIEFEETIDFQWNITDVYGATYEVTVNGVVVLDGDFTGDYQVDYTFNGTTDGEFTISISVTSISGKTVSDEVTITVNPEPEPEKPRISGFGFMSFAVFSAVALMVIRKKIRK